MSTSEIYQAYTNPKLPGSFSGIKSFLQHNKKFEDTKYVRKTLQNLNSYTLHRPTRQGNRRKVHVTFPSEIQAMDLLDISDNKISRQNRGMKWILVFCDIFSRRIWAYPLKNKAAETVSEVLDSHFKKKENRCAKIWSDRDKSFLASKSMTVLRKYGIELYHTSSYLKSVFAERYIQEIKKKIYRIFTQNKNKKWVDELPSIVEGINHSVNKTTGFRPIDVTMENSDKVWRNIYASYVSKPQPKPKYAVGDLVRLTKLKNVFAKGYKSGWTEEIFRVYKTINTNPVTYLIEDMDGSKIKGTMYDFELNPVSSIQPV